MANSAHFCNVLLSLFVVLRQRGVSAHDFGAAVIANMQNNPGPATSTPATVPPPAFFEAAAASADSAKPEEFVYEAEPGPEAEAWSMTVRSCAICHAYAKQDAMELVPYMCATDDVVSDQRGEGLRRSGTIALGATQCDFHYRAGNTPARVADQYPDKIRLVTASPS